MALSFSFLVFLKAKEVRSWSLIGAMLEVVFGFWYTNLIQSQITCHVSLPRRQTEVVSFKN